jgi:penicillin-binding protein 1A
VTENPPPETPQDPWKGPRQTIRADLRPRSRRRGGVWRIAATAAVAVLLLAVLGAAIGWKVWFSDLPQIPAREALWSMNRAPGMTFLDRNGDRIASRGPRHGVRVSLASLPPHVAHAFLAAEDRRFYRHGPIDMIGIARSAWANLSAGEVVQGGSTLTQQLAKTIFLKPDQTLKRKLQEAVLARRLERRLGKDAVLELYLNRIFFGANAYGLQAASETYFGKSAAQLTLAEAALLAALPKAPSRLAPTRDLAGAIARSHLVLTRMREEGWITRQAELAAIASPPRLAPPPSGEGDFGYALDLAGLQAQALAGSQAPDLIVQLTIDPQLQAQASQIVRQVMAAQGGRAGAEQAALVALGPDGAVRALVGGVDHAYSPFDRASQARRQPGSAFKPFIYAAALEAGVSPADVRQDRPVRLGSWTPQNYGGGYRGAVTVAEALAQSINTVAVRLAQEAGAARIGELAQRFGIAGIPARPQLSVALGSYEVSLLDLAGGYQVFQQGGRRYPPYLVQGIATAGGRQLYLRQPSAALQVYDPGRAQMMVRMMMGVIDHGTGRRAAFGRPAAGKTGTSQNWRDAWFVGFTPDWVCGVWVGNDDNTPMNRITGGQLPAEIWRRFMIAAHQGIASHAFDLAPLPAAASVEAVPAQAETAAPPAEPPGPEPAPREARAGFYDDLSQAFAGSSPP